MSLTATRWAWQQASTSKPFDQIVLVAIADCWNDDNQTAYPSLETLARMTRSSKRAVQRALGRLEKLGVLAVEHTGGGRFSTRYRIVFGLVANPGQGTTDLGQGTTDGHRRPSVTDDPGSPQGRPSVTAGVTQGHRRGDPQSPEQEYNRKERPMNGKRSPPLLRGPDPNCYRDAPGVLGVPHKLHRDWLELREARGLSRADAAKELDVFYDAWIERYQTGDRRTTATEANRFKFWEARYAETWPAPRSGSQPTAVTVNTTLTPAMAARLRTANGDRL